ncbi:MAG: hypothetical protein WC705_03505 [Candidatus Paceibacterota bacterium]|jgi:hypothetical protein
MPLIKIPKNLKVVYVDGFKIRNHIDDDFAIAHVFFDELCYFPKKFYIPKDEIWIDYHYRNETEFLIKTQHYFSFSAKSYLHIRNLMKKELCKKGPVPDFKLKIFRKDSKKIVYVDGKVLREYIDPEFVMGGHGLVYSYIPENEIWIDVKVDLKEVPYILLHERVEYDLMKKGKSYDVAHEYAVVADKEERRKRTGASYAGDYNYPWYGQSNKKIIKKITVSQKIWKIKS